MLDVFAVLRDWAEQTATHFDQLVYETDDGEMRSVKSAKAEFVEQVDALVIELQRLKVAAVNNGSFVKFLNDKMER